MARAPDIIKAEIARLETKARVRRGKPGFSQNLEEIDARLAELRLELQDADNG
jgi:phosphopentomutase